MLRKHRYLVLLVLLVLLTAGITMNLNQKMRVEPTRDCDEITMILPTYGFVPDDMDRVLKRMNARSEMLCGVRITPIFINASDLEMNVDVRLKGGEEIDLMPCMEGSLLTRYIDEGIAAPLSGLLDEYGQDILATMPEQIWKVLSLNDEIYAVSSLNAVVNMEGLVIRKDVLDAVGVTKEELIQQWDPAQRHTMAQLDMFLTPLLEAIHTSDATLSDGGTISSMGLAASTNRKGGLFAQCNLLHKEGFGNDFGCTVDDSGTIVDLYQMEEFREMLRLIRSWQERGYIYSMNAQLGENPIIVYESGKVCGFFSDTSSGMEASYSAQSGHESVCIPLVTSTITNEMTQIGNWVIPQASSKKEAAMKLLNLMYTDEEYVSLYINGIEGEHYTLREDGSLEILSRGYTQHLTWIFGNVMLAASPEQTRSVERLYDASNYSVYFGFLYDSTRFTKEIAEMSAIVDRALPRLLLGEEPDVDAALDELNRQLKDLGIGQVIQDKQKQLSEWM